MADPKVIQDARRRLGTNLATARRKAGLTQAELAAAIIYSRSSIANVETGQQKVNREFWHRCDELLQAKGALTAEHDRIAELQNTHLREHLIAAFGEDNDLPSDWQAWLRRAVVERPVPAGDPPALPALEEALRAGNQAYQAARYSQLVRLPKVLGFAELLISNAPTSDITRLAQIIAGGYLLFSKLAAKMAATDIAWTAADRAASFGLITGDPVITALASYQTACALAKQKHRLAEAEEVAATAADRIAGHRLSNTPPALSVRGALWLHAAIAAARRGHSRDAQAHLQHADELATALGRDANEMWTAFGPANVRLHAVSAAVAQGDVREAFHQADRVDTSKLPAVLVSRRAQLHLDLGAAHAQATDSDPQALLHLLEYERIVPEAVSLNATAGNLIGTLLERERLSQTPGLRALAERAGVTR